MAASSLEDPVREQRVAAPASDLDRAGAELVTEQIRQATVRTLEAMSDVEDAVRAAYGGRAWLALGYGSWEDYCATEFAQSRLWGSADDRQARVQALRSSGLSIRAIAAVLGVGRGTAQRDVASISTVPGGTVDISEQSDGTEGASRSGAHSDRTEGIDGRVRPALRAMPEQLLERKLSVAELHSDGLRQEEIAERLGVSQATVSADLTEMRRMAEVAPQPIREALTDTTLSRAETMSRLHDLVLPRVQLGPIAKTVIHDVAAATRTLHRDVLGDDAWQDDGQRRAAATAIVAGGLGEVLILAAELAAHITREDVQAEEHIWLRFTQALGDAARALTGAARSASADL